MEKVRINPAEITQINRNLSTPVEIERSALGPVRKMEIPTLLERPTVLPEFNVELPTNLAVAIGELADEYDTAFSDNLLPNHVESDSDYLSTKIDNKFSSLFYQIDMAALPESFLEDVRLGKVPFDELKEIIRARIFEFEDSIAMYGLIRNAGSELNENGEPVGSTKFATKFDAAIDVMRQQHGAVVVGAIDDDKFQNLIGSELGIVQRDDPRLLDNDFIRAHTGFDGYISPDEVQELITRNDTSTLIFARTSPAPNLLRQAGAYASQENNLLANFRTRLGLRALALTLNIDNPRSEFKLNDTKLALPFVNPFSVLVDANNFHQLNLDEVSQQLGIQPADKVRIKPTQAYGAYRQSTKPLEHSLVPGSNLHNQLVKNPTESFIIQPEIPGLVLKGSEHGDFGGIFRIFVSKNIDSGKFEVIGGQFNLLPVDNDQARKNNFHGNAAAVFAEISVESSI